MLQMIPPSLPEAVRIGRWPPISFERRLEYLQLTTRSPTTALCSCILQPCHVPVRFN